MKNRITHSLFFALMLLIANVCFAQNQQASQIKLPSALIDEKCLVTMTGAVNKPGRFELRRPLNLLEAISFAGGPTERAGKTIKVAHPVSKPDCENSPENAENQRSEGTEVFELSDLLRTGMKTSPPVQPGDDITVSEVNMAYVIGSVVKPQLILLKAPISVMQAIALAGGTLPNADIEKIRVMHCQPKTKDVSLSMVNLKKASKHRNDDLLLQPEDVVDVWNKGGRIIKNLSIISCPRTPTQQLSQLPLYVIR